MKSLVKKVCIKKVIIQVCMFKKEYIYYSYTKLLIPFTVIFNLLYGVKYFRGVFGSGPKILIGSRSNLSKRPDLTTDLGNQTLLGHWVSRLKQFCKYCSFVSPKDIWETKNSLPTNTVNNKIWENRVRLYTSCITGKGKGKKGKHT